MTASSETKIVKINTQVFSPPEDDRLCSLIEAHYEVLSGTGQGDSNKRRNAAWKAMAENISSEFGVIRSGLNIKNRWYYLSSKARNAKKTFEKSQTQTRGGKLPVDVSEKNGKTLSILGQDNPSIMVIKGDLDTDSPQPSPIQTDTEDDYIRASIDHTPRPFSVPATPSRLDFGSDVVKIENFTPSQSGKQQFPAGNDEKYTLTIEVLKSELKKNETAVKVLESEIVRNEAATRAYHAMENFYSSNRQQHINRPLQPMGFNNYLDAHGATLATLRVNFCEEK